LFLFEEKFFVGRYLIDNLKLSIGFSIKSVWDFRKECNIMSFAHDFWEEFEKLSIDLLKSYFKNIESTKISINRTQNQKDGGYDGIIFISTDSKHTPYKILS